MAGGVDLFLGPSEARGCPRTFSVLSGTGGHSPWRQRTGQRQRPAMTVSLLCFVWSPGWETNQKVISFQKLEPTVELVTAFRFPCGFWKRVCTPCVI